MNKDSKILVDIHFRGRDIVEITIDDIGLSVDDIVKKKKKKHYSYFLKVEHGYLYDSKSIKVKRLILLENDRLLESIKDMLIKPLKNVMYYNVYFKRMLLDNHNIPVYKKSLIALGLDLSKVHNIEHNGFLNMELNGFRCFVQHNLIRNSRAN